MSRPNDCNMPTQHIETLLGATCCVRFKRTQHEATVLRHVGCCWFKFDHFQTWANNTQHVATHRNMVAKRTQQRNNVVICCIDMLESFDRGLRLWHLKGNTYLYFNFASCTRFSCLANTEFFQLILLPLLVLNKFPKIVSICPHYTK